MEWLNKLIEENPILQMAFDGFGIALLGGILPLIAWFARRRSVKTNKSVSNTNNITKEIEKNVIYKLETILSKKYFHRHEAALQTVVEDAGVKISEIDWKRSVDDQCSQILRLVKQRPEGIKKLVEAIYQKDPDDFDLREIYEFYGIKRTAQVSRQSDSFSSWLILLVSVLLMFWLILRIQPLINSLQLSSTLFNPWSILTPVITPKDLGCMSFSNPPLHVGDQGQICLTKGPDLRMRDTAGGPTIISKLKNRTLFTVIGGPECAYYDYTGQNLLWWQVKTIDGQSGWLVDGGDNKGDPVYLCRITGTSFEVVQAITNYWSLWGQEQGCQAAWSILSDSFKRTQDYGKYISTCRQNNVQVTQIIDLNNSPDSVIQNVEQCALVRIQFSYGGTQEMTFALIKSGVTADMWQIYFVRPDHTAAQELARDVCNN